MPNPVSETIGHDHVVNEIFLTPRVIDAGAFGKYSAVLRELIESSETASARLAAERERAEAAIQRAGAASGGEPRAQPTTAQGSIDQAAAVRIARLEATVAELAGRLEQAEASASEAKSIARGQARGAGDERAVLGSELTPEFDEALARAEAAEDRLGKLVGMAERAGEELAERVGDVIGKAASSGAELTAMIMMLAEQIEKAEALSENIGENQNPSGSSSGGLESSTQAPVDAETLRTIGQLLARVHEAIEHATERTEALESMNIRADASGEALLRAARSATDGAVNAESIAERLTGLVQRAEAIGARIGNAPGGAANGAARPSPLVSVIPKVNDNLAAGERLSLGTPGPVAPTQTDVKPGGRDLRSFEERAQAADPIDKTGSPLPAGPARPMNPMAQSRPFPPTPIDPSLVSKPQLRRPTRPIDAEDFGA